VEFLDPDALTVDCIFCKIGSGELAAQSVYRDDDVIVIADVNPQAPVHLLAMHLRHHATLAELFSGDRATAAHLFEVAAKLGQERGGEEGFRLVVNTGQYGGQTVDHVHVHVMSGRRMTWPPG
jgi:histidine triad (HIT) family protein